MRWMLMLWCLAGSAAADTIVAARTLRPFTILEPVDLIAKRGDTPGGFETIEPLIGQETRVAIYAGRPIRQGEVGPPALVERNQIVALRYQMNGLLIEAEGRALSRAGFGDLVRVMNLSSRQTIQGRVGHDGSILVAR